MRSISRITYQRTAAFSISFRLPIFSHMDDVKCQTAFDREDLFTPKLLQLATHEDQSFHVLSLPVNMMKNSQEITPEIRELLINSVTMFNFDPIKIFTLHSKIKEEIESRNNTDLRKSGYLSGDPNIGERTLSVEMFRDIALSENAEFDEMPLQYKIDFLKSVLFTDFESIVPNPNVLLFLRELIMNDKLNEKEIVFSGMPELLYRTLASNHINANTVLSDYKNLLIKLEQQYGKLGLLNTDEKLTLNSISKFQIYKNGSLFRNNYSYELARHIMQEFHLNVIMVADPETKNDLLDLDAAKSILRNEPLDKKSLIDSHRRYEKLMNRLIGPEHARQYFQTKEARQGQAWNFNNNIIDRFLVDNFRGVNHIPDLRHFGVKKHTEMILNMAMFEVAFDTTLLESEEIANKFFYLAQDESSLARIETEELERKFYVCYQTAKKSKMNLLNQATAAPEVDNLSHLQQLLGISE